MINPVIGVSIGGSKDFFHERSSGAASNIRTDLIYISEFLQLVEIRIFFMEVNLFFLHGVLECWSVGVLEY
jgi:hypothetical protein